MERKSPAPQPGTKTDQQAQIAYYEDGSLIDLEPSDTRLWVIRQGSIQKETDVNIPGENRVVRLGTITTSGCLHPSSEMSTADELGLRVRYRALGRTVVVRYDDSSLPHKREALLHILSLIMCMTARNTALSDSRMIYEYQRAEESSAERAREQRSQSRLIESMREEIAELETRVIKAENSASEAKRQLTAAEKALTLSKVCPWDKLAPRVKPLLEEIDRLRAQMAADAQAYEQAHPQAARALFDRGTLTEWEIAKALENAPQSIGDPTASPSCWDPDEEPSTGQRGTLPYKPDSDEPRPPPISVPPASSVDSFERLLQTKTWEAVRPPEPAAPPEQATDFSFRDSLLEDLLDDFRPKK
ncbi:MAG TPA: hypothetical protein PLF71_00875 [bacterium]|nr:hypothetical protein [bacterium]